MSSFNKSILFATIWSVFGQLGAMIITLVTNVILARVLTPVEFGQLGIIMFFIVLANVFTEGGLAGALVRKENITNDDYSTVFVFNLLVSISCFIVMVIIAGPISRFYKDVSLQNVLVISSIVLIINAFQITQIARLMREMKYKKISLYRLVAVFFSSLIGIFLVFKGAGIWSLVIIQILTAVFTTALLWIYEGAFFKLSFNKESFKQLYKFGVNTTLASLLDTAYDNVYQLVIGRFFSINQVGLYYQAKKLQEVPISVIKTTTLGVVFSSLSEIQNDKILFTKTYNKITLYFTIAMGFLTVLLFVLSENVILVIYGVKWINSAFYIKLLSIASFFFMQEMFNRVLFKVFNQTHKILYLEIAKKSIQSLGILIGIIKMDIEILLYGFIISNIISYLINFYYSRKVLGSVEWYEIVVLAKVVGVSVISVFATSYIIQLLGVEIRYVFTMLPFLTILYFTLIQIFGITNLATEYKSIILLIKKR